MSMKDLNKKPTTNIAHHMDVLGRHFGVDDWRTHDPFASIGWELSNVAIQGLVDGEPVEVFRQNGVEFPCNMGEQARQIVASKYFYGQLGTAARETSFKQLINRVVNRIVKWATLDGYFDDKPQADSYANLLKHMLVRQMYAYNSPVWFNIGTPGREQASACFLNSVEDSLESINELQTSEALIFQWGSGSGVNLSNIRAQGEPLSGGGAASGPISFMKGLDAFAGVIKSGGKKRRAAKMVILDTDHPDIMDFIQCKALEENKVRALVAGGYSNDFTDEDGAYATVAFQNANNSIRVSNEFMHCATTQDPRDQLYNTTLRTTGEPASRLNARDVLMAAAEACHASGDPGIQYEGAIAYWHTCPESGRCSTTNPCSEYIHLDDTACNLASHDLLKYTDLDTGTFHMAPFISACAVVAFSMDVLVHNADYPTPKIKKATLKSRTLGMGFANLGGMLMSLGVPYDSDEGRMMAHGITHAMNASVYHQSAFLAQRLGSFKLLKKNQEAMCTVMEQHLWAASKNAIDVDDVPYTLDAWDRRFPTYAYSRLEEMYLRVINDGVGRGYMRNAQATCLAPTGTISFYMECDTTGVEPIVSPVSFKKLVGGGTLRMLTPSISRGLTSLGYSAQDVQALNAHVEDGLELQDHPVFNQDHLPVFESAFGASNNVSWQGHVNMMHACQPGLSGAISKTVNVPSTATPQDIFDIYEDAWERGLKAIAVYRDGCKSSQPVSTTDTDAVEDRATVLAEPGPRERLPTTRVSMTHKWRVGNAEGYVTAGLYPDGSPGEIFIVASKAGSTMRGLLDAVATAVSIGLQYGAPLATFVDKYTGTQFEPAGFTGNADPSMRSASSVLDYVFKWLRATFIEDTPPTSVAAAAAALPLKVLQPAAGPTGQLCDNCGTEMTRAGACYVCSNCGETTGCG